MTIGRERMIWATAALLLVILLAVTWGSGNARLAQAEQDAERARTERVAATREAASQRAAYDAFREESFKEESRLLEMERRASERATVAEAKLALRTTDTDQAGELLREGILEALGATEADPPVDPEDVIALLDHHLEAVTEERASWKQLLEEEEAKFAASQDLNAVQSTWIQETEWTLESCEVECKLCRDEANQWRQLSRPGFFEKIRRGFPWFGSGIGAGVLLVVLL